MSDVPDETENENILAFRSKDEAQIKRVQKAAENIAERMLKDALDLCSPNRTFNDKKKENSRGNAATKSHDRKTIPPDGCFQPLLEQFRIRESCGKGAREVSRSRPGIREF